MIGRAIPALALCLLALLAGCGSGRVSVSGEVTHDGKPLEKGVIVFSPAEGEGKDVTATIENGRYRLETTPGRKNVQISASVVVGKAKEYEGADAKWMDVMGELLPPEYNEASKLTYEVTSGLNTKNWELKGKRKTK